MTKRKKQQYETVHDENLLAAKLQGAAALLIFLFYTARGLFMGDTLADGFKRSWLSGFGIVLLLFVLIIAMLFFLIGCGMPVSEGSCFPKARCTGGSLPQKQKRDIRNGVYTGNTPCGSRMDRCTGAQPIRSGS